MTTREMRQHINVVASSVKKHFKETSPKDSKLIDINFGLPYLAINLPTGEEYFFQEDAANEILEEAKNAANKFNTSIENTLIWMSQTW